MTTNVIGRRFPLQFRLRTLLLIVTGVALVIAASQHLSLGLFSDPDGSPQFHFHVAVAGGSEVSWQRFTIVEVEHDCQSPDGRWQIGVFKHMNRLLVEPEPLTTPED